MKRLEGVHPDLQRVVFRALELGPLEFIVTEGIRSKARQAQLVKAGASKTMNSRHLTGHAVDLAVRVGGKIRWDWPLYHILGKQVKEAAKVEGVSIVWGGDWVSFKDGPHFELSHKYK
jgi:peptidoglycan L-alanyl-D-glutamate endopeptidase CwlK